MKVLVVEDDPLLSEFIVRCLEKNSYVTKTVAEGLSGYEEASEGTYDIILLDINLPRMSGLDICKKLRENDVSTPIIFLSANDRVRDRIAGLSAGADDYMTKPFSYEELIARVEAISRRSSRMVPSILEYGDLTLDKGKRVVTRNKKSIKLTPNEFKLLELLVRNPETVLSKEYILQYVWSVGVGNTSNRLEVCIRNLRIKLDQPHSKRLINTEYGIGYKLTV